MHINSELIGIETIKNPNETTLKFPDGTMVIYGNFTENNAGFSRLGDALFYYHSCTITFKSKFIAIPDFVLCTSEKKDDNSNVAIFNGFEKPTTIDTIYPRFIRPIESTFNLYIRYIAIGKWK